MDPVGAAWTDVLSEAALRLGLVALCAVMDGWISDVKVKVALRSGLVMLCAVTDGWISDVEVEVEVEIWVGVGEGRVTNDVYEGEAVDCTL